MNDFLYRFFGNPFGEFPKCRKGGVPVWAPGSLSTRAGYILTNNHVVDRADRIQVKFPDDSALL